MLRLPTSLTPSKILMRSCEISISAAESLRKCHEIPWISLRIFILLHGFYIFLHIFLYISPYLSMVLNISPCFHGSETQISIPAGLPGSGFRCRPLAPWLSRTPRHRPPRSWLRAAVDGSSASDLGGFTEIADSVEGHVFWRKSVGISWEFHGIFMGISWDV